MLMSFSSLRKMSLFISEGKPDSAEDRDRSQYVALFYAESKVDCIIFEKCRSFEILEIQRFLQTEIVK